MKVAASLVTTADRFGNICFAPLSKDQGSLVLNVMDFFFGFLAFSLSGIESPVILELMAAFEGMFLCSHIQIGSCPISRNLSWPADNQQKQLIIVHGPM